MENNLVNPDFERVIRQMRRILPMLSFGLLIGTYLLPGCVANAGVLFSTEPCAPAKSVFIRNHCRYCFTAPFALRSLVCDVALRYFLDDFCFHTDADRVGD